MKKITIIAHGLSNGGSERVSSILANYFDNQNYKVQYIAVYSEEKVYKLNENIEYNYINVNKNEKNIFKFFKRSLKLRKIVKNYHPDVIISFICNETILLNQKRIIYSLRIDPADLDNTETKNRRFKKIVRNYCYKRCKKVVFQTKDAKEYFKQNIQKKGIVIANPIETDNMPKWEENEHSKSIITACRLSTQKNIPLLIKSFYQISNAFPEYNLNIYGNGEEYDNISNLIKELNLENRVKLMGYANNIHQIMASSSLFVLSSDYEGLSNSMLEALVIGVPCICTDCPPGGARMFINNDENGMLTLVKDVDSLSKSMKYVLSNYKDVSVKFNNNNRKYRKLLSTNNICRDWEKLF